MNMKEAIRKTKYLYEKNKGITMVLNSWRDKKNDKVDQRKKWFKPPFLVNGEHFHTKCSRREEEIFNQESKWKRKHTVHRDFTLETQMGKLSFLEHLSLLLYYSFKIKGYMPNLGLHLRHNQHHTLLPYTRTTL